MFLRKICTVIVFVAVSYLGLTIAKADGPKDFRVYFIGNSVTDLVRYSSLADLATSRGITLKWGRHMIPGAPLEWIYTHPNDGFEEDPYGHWQQALGQFPWDAVSIQPFDRQLQDVNTTTGEDMGDVALITHFAEMAAKQNPEVQIYIYARWPRISRGGKPSDYNKNDYDPTKKGDLSDFATMDDYVKLWERPYTGGWDFSNESRAYFDQLLDEVRKKTPFLKNQVLLVPVGQVMEELHKKMTSGQVPGYQTIFQFYKDGIHLNEVGSYVVGCTFFATLLKQSPVGLPTQPYGDIKPDLAAIIQKTAWDVVTTNPETGVTDTSK